MQFRRLAAAFETIESTSKRLELTSQMVALLGSLPAALVDKCVLMLQGKLYPDFVGVELGVAEKLTVKALARTYGVPEADLVALQKRSGDLGLAAEETARRRTQRGLESRPLTVEHVYATFEKIAQSSGAGSQDQKIGGLAELLHAAEPVEARYLVRLATGKLRLGVADQTVLEALAVVLSGGKEGSVTELSPEERTLREEAKALAQRALDVSSDLGLVAKTALEGGLPALRKVHLRLGVPLRPMLAERAESVDDAMARMPGRAFIEYKYDGLRMQAHIDAKQVRIFSRRLESLTDQFPDVTAALAKAFQGRRVIVEGEAVAVDARTGRIRPFQELSQRRGRKYGLGPASQTLTEGADARDVTKEIPVRLFLFDLLWDDGDDYTTRPLEERRERLTALLRPDPGVAAGDLRVMTTPREVEEYFDQVTQMGAEGIMIKNPTSPYEAGGRGYNWIKFKADYDTKLADSFDLVAIGAYWGQGRRGGWYGALLLASINDATGRFESLCRCATGFDDATLASLEERFAPFVANKKPRNVETTLEPDVWFDPRIVLEVVGAELTISPNHRSAWGALRPDAGLSVRFPRFMRWRDDKRAEQATTSQEVLRLFDVRRTKRASA